MTSEQQIFWDQLNERQQEAVKERAVTTACSFSQSLNYLKMIIESAKRMTSEEMMEEAGKLVDLVLLDEEKDLMKWERVYACDFSRVALEGHVMCLYNDLNIECQPFHCFNIPAKEETNVTRKF